MYICSICSAEFAIKFIYDLHFTKCNEKHMKIECDMDEEMDDDMDDIDDKGGGLMESYKNQRSQYSVALKGGKISTGQYNELKQKLVQLESRIIKLEKRNKIVELPLPLNDYMNWIKTIEVTEADCIKSFDGVVGVIKKILSRNKFQSSGVFYKWMCGSKLKLKKLLVGKKIAGMNSIILSYKWDYAKMSDVTDIVDYFWDKFKGRLGEWFETNENKITDKIDNYDRLYEKYYNNVILTSEVILVREIKEFLILGV